MTEKQKIAGYVGIGIFTFLSVSELEHLLSEIFKNLSFHLSFEPLITYTFSNVFGLFFFIFSVIFIIRKLLKLEEINITKCFVIAFTSYFVIQIIQMFLPWIIVQTGSGFYLENKLNYHNYLKENYLLYALESLLYYIGLITIIIFLYRKIKKNSRFREKEL